MNTNDNQIEAKETDYLYKVSSRLPNAGQGLFTAIDIYKDETIAIFKGELLKTKESIKRSKTNEDQYFITLLTGQILDSKNIECFAKYANDAKGSPDLNIKNNAKITLDENDNICLQATKKILAGDEVLVSYGKRYWEKHRR